MYVKLEISIILLSILKIRCLHLTAMVFCALVPVPQVLEGDMKSKEVKVHDGVVTVTPPEFHGAINNPLKGFRDYKKGGYGLVTRQYIKWNDIEIGAGDSVERIIAHTNKITCTEGKYFEDLNLKLVPRVFLDWNGKSGPEKNPQQHWPVDLQTFDYDSPEFQQRLQVLVAKLGQAWDEDPRVFAVQMGLIGHFGEHHDPAPTSAQRRLLAEAFQKAFKHKPVLVRHHDPEFMEAGFGIHYDTFANISREPPGGPKDQFPWQATHVHQDVWKQALIEGEVEYNWQMERKDAMPEQTFGRNPNETMTVPRYRRFMIDKIRRYHASYLGWLSDYDSAKNEVLAGAGEIQQACGYRFVIDSASYPLVIEPGAKLPVTLTVRNTGSAPFYLDWPVAVGLLDPATKKPVWSAPMSGVDVRKWLPGEEWDSEIFAYRSPAVKNSGTGKVALPDNIQRGKYIIALGILDRQGGMMPSVRFATTNYFRGGWHPLGYIGIGETPEQATLEHVKFDNPAFDESLHYKIPDGLRKIQAPAAGVTKPVVAWTSDPKVELINPWRYWSLNGGSKSLEMEILDEGCRVIRVSGDFGKDSSLKYDFGNGTKLERGRYCLRLRVRGTAGQTVEFEVADDWRGISKEVRIPLASTWTEHRIEFEIKTEFKDATVLRFNLPPEVKGIFDLSQTRLLRME